MLTVTHAECHVKARYAECYAEYCAARKLSAMNGVAGPLHLYQANAERFAREQ